MKYLIITAFFGSSLALGLTSESSEWFRAQTDLKPENPQSEKQPAAPYTKGKVPGKKSPGNSSGQNGAPRKNPANPMQPEIKSKKKG